MNYLKCPITGETILKITPKGIFQRVNYSEIFFKLNDGSKMRIAVSKNAKKSLTEKQADDLFSKINKDRINRIKTKALDEDVKNKQLKRITDLKYNLIEDRGGSLFKKN